MLKFVVSEDKNWLNLIDYDEDFERKQIEISLTKKIYSIVNPISILAFHI